MTQTPESNVPPKVAPSVVPYQGPAPGGGLVGYAPTQDERTMAMLIWLLGLLSGWVGPLIIWLVKREQSKFIDFHGKQALFLHVAATVLAVVLAIPMVILMMIPFVGCLVIPFFMLVGVGLMVLQILLAVKANSGEWYRLPVVGAWA